jgi:hypothetical protein
VKTFRAGLFGVTVVLIAGVRAALAQELPRADTSATLGVEAVRTQDNTFYRSSSFDGGLFGAVSAGWYWTENLKTEVEFGGRTKGRVFVPEPAVIGGLQTSFATEKRFSRQAIALGQQYQFFHNVWFHPHLGAGANFTFERSTYHRPAISVYDPVSRTSRLVSPERNEPSRTDFHVSPFVEGGFKAYMTPRTFFRADLRVAFRHRVDDVVTRFGFGFDF